MKNSEYWKKRFEDLEDEQYRKSLEYYKDLQNQFRIAQNNITLEIEHWYQRLADNNNLSLAGARKLLKKNELEEFKWNVEQYIKKGEENAISQQWVKQLENASAKYHISYLEGMKLQIQQHCELLSTQYESGMTDFLYNTYTEQFCRTAYEVQKGKCVGWNLAKPDTNKINKVLQTPWAKDGKVFSERIWTNKRKLINELHTELSQSLILGEDPKKAIQRLADSMDVSRNTAGRLVMTESAAISSVSRKDCFRELDVEEFEIVATLDSHTSQICRQMDGKHFPMSQWEIGVTAPPFHVRCRSTTVPYFEDDFGSVGERAARGEDGKTYYVPADMTYKAWKNAFVDGDKTDLQEINPDGKIKIKALVTKPESTHIVIDRPIIEQDAIIEQAKIYGDDLLQHSDLIKYDNGEPISNYVNNRIGYNALPKVVTADEFKQLSEGKQILYRGITDYKDISAREMVEQFKTGSFYCGRGVYGNGTYADSDEKVAMYYAYDSSVISNGEIMGMLLSDDAKTISFLDIYTEYEKTGIPKLAIEKREVFQDIIGNVGVYAAIKGYDAIFLDGFNNKHYVVILNRSKVIVKE